MKKISGLKSGFLVAAVIFGILASVYVGAGAFAGAPDNSSSSSQSATSVSSASTETTTILYCSTSSEAQRPFSVPNPEIIALLPQIQSSPAVIEAEANYSNSQWVLSYSSLSNGSSSQLVDGKYVTTHSQEWVLNLYVTNQSPASINPCSSSGSQAGPWVLMEVDIPVSSSSGSFNMTGITARLFIVGPCNPLCP